MNLELRFLAGMICWLTMWAGFSGSAPREDLFERRASWQPASEAAARERVMAWIEEEELTARQREQIERLWPVRAEVASSAGMAPEMLERAATTIALVYPDLVPWLMPRMGPGSPRDLPVGDLLNDGSVAEFARHHVRLVLGKWLAVHEFYDEALAMLEPLTLDQVIDPAALLFYRAAAQYRLRDRETGLQSLDRLLEQRDVIPKRFATLAEMMRADLQQLEVDTLDEVSRIMDSVRVRLRHGRAGTRVRDEEEQVIAKLDKLIDELEKQRQQMQQQSSGPAGGSGGTRPAEDSFLPEMQASGDVDPKQLGSDTDWGQLPPKERQEALQLLGKDFPSHYREVIEEYFRRLAREEPPETP